MANSGTPEPKRFGLIENCAHGEVEPIPTLPVEPTMERAERVDVAVPSTDVVAKYKFPPAFLCIHCNIPALAESES